MSLFQTNAWQKAWWAEWADTPGATLVSEGGNGRSGLYVHGYRHGLPVKTQCMQYVGTSYRKFSAPRTEYNTLGHLNDLPAVLTELEQAQWTEAVFSDLKSESEEQQMMQSWARKHGWLLREIYQDVAYGIAATGAFEDYLGTLGKNTRLKLFNRRKMFESLGDVAEENFWPYRAKEFFELLNGFHEVRWGSPCFSHRSVAFHLDFLGRAAADEIHPLLMVLHIDQRPVSVLYNALFRGCVYNIQAGFDENFHRKIALGTLHLGYSIESAIRDPSVQYFDLLAGEGKNTNYKVNLATDQESLVTFMIVRNRLFELLYRTKDAITRLKRKAR
ncbi:GNAT family N-acetyltransferase [Marinobacter halotolerans]|uniref:GNAT family N-acetyltransferase n=1 Tax=Marinobacter halotolerans TaxID=1569211 RepID=UPI0012445B1E|nr:GNAT family N-acetyltransferase [Marinobacter halotolerans]